MSSYYQGTHQTERLEIARVAGFPSIADIEDAEFALSKLGVVRLTVGLGSMTITEDAENVYLDFEQVPADSEGLAGEYTATWEVKVDGRVVVSDGGTRTILVSVVS